MAMRVLQIGGGSMGTRRMRDLHELPHGTDPITIQLLDARDDRRAAAAERFGVRGVATMAEALAFEPDVFVISTPPHLHQEFVTVALDLGKHVFCEADIWPFDAAAVHRAQAQHPGLIAAPSATLRFQPVIREVARIVAAELGTLHAFGYVLSVDAPGWHPGEGAEYYARHRPTAPAREMTAFELIALQDLFGPAATVSGLVHRRGSLGTDIEDTFSLQYRTEAGAAGQLTVLMAPPQAARRGWAAGDNGLVYFDLLTGVVDRQLPALDLTDSRKICDWAGTIEQVYLDEISTFVSATEGTVRWPYSYSESALVCGTLAAAELSMVNGSIERVRADLVPAAVPDAYVRSYGTAG
jgi:predicted dehydrogenase